jgi:hypothetical protein
MPLPGYFPPNAKSLVYNVNLKFSLEEKANIEVKQFKLDIMS